MPINPLIIPAAISAVGQGVSGFFGAKGAKDVNRTNQREAQKNRDFQERMRNTEWQAAVEDMRQAGLNPALALQHGGASSPGGSMPAGAENTVSSALQAMEMRKSLQLLDESIKKTRAESRSAEAEASVSAARSNFLTRSFSVNGHRSAPAINELLQAEVDGARAGATNLAAQAARNQHLARIAKPMADLSQDMGRLLPILGLFTGAAGGAARILRSLPKLRKK